MGGRGGSGKSGARGGGAAGKPNRDLTVREGMSVQEVDAVHTQLAKEVSELKSQHDKDLQKLSNQAISGKLSVAQTLAEMNRINEEYDKKLRRLQSINSRLSSMYGVSQTF